MFRFLCLQVGYAAFRLKHWWVIAVSELIHVIKYCKVIFFGGKQIFVFLPPQITTLVTSVFLVLKVILSNVSVTCMRLVMRVCGAVILD